MKTAIYKFFNSSNLVLLSTLMIFSDALHAQVTFASWALGSNANSTTSSGITASTSLGAGVTHVSYGQHYGSSGCTGRIINNWNSANTSISTAISGNKYIEFAITPTGQNLLISSFQFSMSAGFTTNGTGSGSMAVRWSKDNFTTNNWLKHPSACAGELLYAANNSNNGSCATYTFNSSSSGSCTGNPWPMAVSAGQTIRFRIYIGTTQSASTWRTSINNVSINGITSLPVTMTNFSASCEKENEVNLFWSTASEQNSEKFIVEKSRDMQNWFYVAEVEGAGNSSYNLDYAVADPSPFGGVSYYRILQQDFNGESVTYGPLSVSCKDLGNAISLFPNPTNGNFTAEILSTQSHGNAEILLADLAGKVISYRTTALVEGVNQVIFDTENLAQGTYLVYVRSEVDFKPVKLIVRQ